MSARTPRPASLRHQACGLGLKPSSNRNHFANVCYPADLPVASCRGAPVKKEENAATNGSAAAAAAQQPYNSMASAAVHGGERAGRPSIRDALTTPIVQTSTYWFENTQQLIDYNEGRFQSYEYGRYGNPTVQAVENKIKELEKAEDCLVSASGMSAVTSMLLSLIPQNGHIVTTSDCYWRTRCVHAHSSVQARMLRM